MRYINRMDIGKALRGLIAKEGRSLRRVSIDLHIDRASLQRSLSEGANPEWKTINKVLDYLGYEIRIVKKAKRARSE
jgi:DNA-binding phage protein